ncbi:unnamed protein product [Rotaria sordida]|uniref:Uncharacterized protein n=1 Tax=Rotaria sordida TaxID=392033 RepID=A0A813X2M7_9BILA|nr:unnamed protein product [Rotaria sordida]CAF0937884.1 unnamed protein product [Rotaria sordida]CAF0978268.1 unnamed protein product [Rotaria sordida]CAF0981605.1 unnamed protein product [Rotaria sordida]CAF3595169.1 unnamed protein product [Rotaria sordida]
MGVCHCHKKGEYFSINDLNGIDKYYSLMSKRKADIFMWLIDSKGPWETPESFFNFKQSDIKKSPVKVSNKDEIQICISKSKPIINSDVHVDQKEICMKLNSTNAHLPIVTSIDINKKSLLDSPSDW